MPKTLDGQIIGGIFLNQEDADLAIEAFEDLDISEENTQVIVQLNDDQAEDTYTSVMVERGISESQALYYEQAIRDGSVLVVVHGVTDPAPIIDIFDEYKAEYNPNGSRNLRDDVAGMTVGAVVGAAAGGIAGAAMGGPVGATAGGVAGAILGGGSGAAVGKTVEHKK